MNITFYNGKLAEYSTPANVSRPPAVYPAPKTEARRTDSDSLLQGDSFSGQQYFDQPVYDLPPALGCCAAPPYPHYDAAPPAFIGGLELTAPVSVEPWKKPEHKPAVLQQQDQQQAYVKKPLNAYMLFLKEQRPHVKAEVKSKGGNAVIAFLVAQWKALSNDQKAKYFEAAEQQRLLHRQQNPGWSNKVNYGKKLSKAQKIKLDREGSNGSSGDGSVQLSSV